MSDSLLADLNPEQLEAVTLPHTSALILAGAGSGKTRVLTTRIAWLIATGQVSPNGILAVTFTNKAAREMLTRISARSPMNPRGMWMGTFHGLCNRLLRTHYRDAQLPQLFQIMDTQDQLALIKRLYKAHNIDEERFPLRQLQYFISGAKEEGLRPNAVEAHDPFSRRQVEHYALYEQACAREGVVDFAELLLRSFELLSRNDALREHYGNRFSHILVDEFQDTNLLQYRWLRLLAGPRAAVFAVGDDDQSIYAFRGANVGNMQSFERDFGPVKLIKLERNYRSRSNILDAANALINNNSQRLGKNLWTDAGQGDPLRAYSAPSDRDEAAFVVDAVKSLVSEGVSADEVAVLYRSNAQSRVLEHALFTAGMPYRVYGGTRFFERAEVKHALAYLRLVTNPNDDSALLRVINVPPRGIGARSIENMQDAARTAGITLWEAARANTVGGRSGTMVAGFIQLIEQLRSESEKLSLPEMVEHLIQRSGLTAHYQAEREGQERVANLAELVNAATAFVQEADSIVLSPGEQVEEAVLTAFLAHAALEAGDTQANEGSSALQLMTVHAAKGLEFHTVFVTGLEEGLFPHENSKSADGGLEEERRLMYVAITRARRGLYLSYAQNRMLHGQIRYGVASRFFDEIPAKLLQWLSGQPGIRMRQTIQEISPRSSANGRAFSPPPKNLASTGPASNFRIGQNVSHPKFGVGIIVNAEGVGNDARLQINFRDVGVKWLALEYAKLSAV